MRVQIFTQLQSIDQQLSELAAQRDVVLAGFAERDRLRTLREARRSLTSTLKHERAISSDLQWELEDLEVRLHALEEQERDGPTDPLVARELVMLRERRAQLEEHVLNELERIASTEAELQMRERELEQANHDWAEREPQLQSRLEQIGHELESRQIQRRELARRLPAGAIELYEDLQRRHRGTALAPIRNRQCSACRARLPAAVFDLLNTPDPLVRCPRCGRVLYLPETSDDHKSTVDRKL